MSVDLFDPEVLVVLLSICFLSTIGEISSLIYLSRTMSQTAEMKKIVAMFIFCIIGTDLMDSISEVVGILYFMSTHDSTNMTLCVLQATGTQFASIASVFFTTAVAWIMYRLAQQKPLSDCYAKTLIAAIFLLSILFTIPPIIIPTYAPANIHCWIDDSKLGLWFRIILFYGPLWCLCIPFTAFIYCKMYFKMKKMELKKKIYGQLILFPIVTIICYLPATITRIIDYLNHWWRPIPNPIELRIVAYASLLSVGMLDSFIFFFYDKTMKLVETLFAKICSRPHQLQDENNNTPGNSSDKTSTNIDFTSTQQLELTSTSTTLHQFSHIPSSQHLVPYSTEKMPLNPIPAKFSKSKPNCQNDDYSSGRIEPSRVSKSKSKSK